MKKVAVVILNWNGRAYLEKFLPSVLASTYPNLDIYVADNASTDDSIAWLRTATVASFKRIKIIENSQNYGFAQGYNEALQHIEADYWVLLNSDVSVAPNWIEPIISLMESNNLIAACQPKILNYHQPQYLEHAGAAGGWIDSLGYPFCRGRVLNVCEPDTDQYNNNDEIAWATGTALFIRSHIYKQLGGFDNHFFAHMEEIDLCWRIRRLGYQVMVCPLSVVWHVGGGTLQKSNPFKTYLNFRNNWAMLLKNLPFATLFTLLPIRLLLDIVAFTTFALKNEWGDAKALIKAHAHFWRDIGKHWKMRQQTTQTIKQYRQFTDRSKAQGYYKGSIVLDFFVKRKKYFSQIIPQ